mgnify:CR=1 FL=1
MPSMHGRTPWRRGMAGGRAEGWRLVNVEPPPAGPPKSLKGGGTIARADLAPGGGALLANGFFGRFARTHCIARRKAGVAHSAAMRWSGLLFLETGSYHGAATVSQFCRPRPQGSPRAHGSRLGRAAPQPQPPRSSTLAHSTMAVLSSLLCDTYVYFADSSEAPSPRSRSGRLRLST